MKKKFRITLLLLVYSLGLSQVLASNSLCRWDANISGQRKGSLNWKPLLNSSNCFNANSFADPYVFLESKTWYITSTYKIGEPMYMFETTDWMNMARYNLEINTNTVYLQHFFKMPQLTPQGIWGFTPYKHSDNKWHAYGTIYIGNWQTFVCHFSPVGSTTWPILSWKLDKILVGSPSDIAYESKVYRDAGGTYLFYVDTLDDGNNHIMVQKMDTPEIVNTLFTARAVLSPEGLRSEDRNGQRSMQICEGTNIALINGKYVMLYSVGDFAHSNYKLGVAYSDVLVPASGQKYTKAKLYDHANVWGNLSSAKEGAYLLQTEKASWPHYADAFLNGPGLGNIIQYNGTYYLVFHARCCGQTGTGKGRWVWKCPITINFTWPEMWKWIQPKLSVED